MDLSQSGDKEIRVVSVIGFTWHIGLVSRVLIGRKPDSGGRQATNESCATACAIEMFADVVRNVATCNAIRTLIYLSHVRFTCRVLMEAK